MKNNETPDDIEIFGHNVAWLRKQNGLSKKEMAKLLHIGVGSLNKIERGELPPLLRADVFFFIKLHFGLSPQTQLTQWLGE